jgi:hypothetical protein
VHTAHSSTAGNENEAYNRIVPAACPAAIAATSISQDEDGAISVAQNASSFSNYLWLMSVRDSAISILF